MGTNLKFMPENKNFYCTYLAIAAKRINKFEILQEGIYQESNNIQICASTFFSTSYIFSQHGCQ